MARVKRGVTAHRRHKKVLRFTRGHRGTKHSLYRRAHESMLHALAYSYAHRRELKGDMRRLWVVRIGGRGPRARRLLLAVHPRVEAGERGAGPQGACRPGDGRPRRVRSARGAGQGATRRRLTRFPSRTHSREQGAHSSALSFRSKLPSVLLCAGDALGLGVVQETAHRADVEGRRPCRCEPQVGDLFVYLRQG